MDRVKGVIIVIIAVASVIVTVLIANILLDTTGKVNQGNFRIADVAIESGANLTEVQSDDTQITKLSDLVFDVSQTNNIYIMIEGNVKPAKMYIDNLQVTDPALKGQMNICQVNQEKYDITPELKRIDLKVEEENQNYIIKLSIDNDNVIRDKSIKEGINSIQLDAAIFKDLGVDIQSLKFNVSFDLYITDELNQTVMAKINLNMPTDEVMTKGMSILKQDKSNFIFSIIE